MDAEPNYFAVALKYVLSERGDAKTLAHDCDISETTVSLIADGKRYPSAPTKQALLKSLNYKEIDFLLLGKSLIEGDPSITPPLRDSVPSSAPISNSSPHSLDDHSLLDKFQYVLKHGGERDKLALEYGVEGVYSRVSRQVEAMNALTEQIRIMNEQNKAAAERQEVRDKAAAERQEVRDKAEAERYERLVSLLSSDSGKKKKEMGSESPKVKQNQQS